MNNKIILAGNITKKKWSPETTLKTGKISKSLRVTNLKYRIMNNNNLKMSFATEANQGTSYTLVCQNNSSVPWVFYVYQSMPNQQSNVFSLAWFASPYKISPGSRISFTWTLDNYFVWGNSGSVVPGINYNAGGIKACSPVGPNVTSFSLDDSTPQLSNPVPGGQQGTLTINQSSNIPNNVFSTGIGMSGQGTFVQQAYQNTTQIYSPSSKYYVAAANQMQMGTVLSQTISQSAEIAFPPNVYNMYATLGENQLWTVSQSNNVLNDAVVNN